MCAEGKQGATGATGPQGTQGVTPKLKIESGYWYVSYNNGTSWSQLGKATGDKGADGDDGDSMFSSVTQDSNYVYFTLANGTTFTVAKVGANPGTPVNGLTITWSSDVTAEQKSILTKLVNNMVKVEGGTFQMGSNDSDAFSGESPVHSVTLTNDYYIGKYEVTQEEWLAVMGTNPSYFSGTNLPVEGVSWNDIVYDFVPESNRLTGLTFRLPTEAEWEYAARGGNRSQGYKYSGSNNIDDVVWYCDNSSSKTHSVGTKQANELGLYDMSGNVWEWCSDWYGSYSSSSQINPTGPTTGSLLVRRGGDWGDGAAACRVSHRDNFYPDNRNGGWGCRLAL